jgi:hypothetical protein
LQIRLNHFVVADLKRSCDAFSCETVMKQSNKDHNPMSILSDREAVKKYSAAQPQAPPFNDRYYECALRRHSSAITGTLEKARRSKQPHSGARGQARGKEGANKCAGLIKSEATGGFRA